MHTQHPRTSAARPGLTGLTGLSALTGLAALTLTLAATTIPAHAAQPPHNELVAVVNETGEQLEFESWTSSNGQTASETGQFVVFATDAPLVPWDDNQTSDVYLRDVGSDVTILVSSRNGKPGNDISTEPTISADGRYVAFTTWADDLTRTDTNGHTLDVVVKDMQRDKIVMASVTSGEKQRDRNSMYPVISDDGRAVSFQTAAALGPKDGDRKEDVYVRDLKAGVTRHASITPKGKDIKGPVLNGDLSGDGGLVVFGIDDNLWVHDVAAGKTRRIWHEPILPACQPNPIGSLGRPAISADGRYVAFTSCAVALVGEEGHHADVFRMELGTGEIDRMTEGNGDSFVVSLSRTGRYVGFGSDASDLVEGDTGAKADAFVLDSRTGTMTRASQALDGTGGDNHSAINDAAISADGQTLVYTSYAENLVENDWVHYPKVLAWRANAPDVED